MKKGELVHLHLLLAKLKKHCEKTSLLCDFANYDRLGITPFNVSRCKEDHKEAIFVLAKELVAFVAAKKNTAVLKTV